MDRADFDDATLMAYADGALDPEAARQVARAAEADAGVAARIAMFRETGARLGALAAARPEPPLPRDLAARIERVLADARRQQAIVAFPARRPAWRPIALAASVALVVGAFGAIVAGLAQRGSAPAGSVLAHLDAPGIGAALDRLPAGARQQAGPGEVTIIASFLTPDGGFCREFELDGPDGRTALAIACREGEGWAARFALVTETAEGAGYAPASSLATLDAFLAAIGAGPPMSAADEAARLRPGH